MRDADGGVEHAQIVVNFGDGSDGGTRAAVGGFLLDGNGGAEAVDGIDFGPLHLIEELARVGRERFDVAALAFGVDGVEGERGFPGAAESRDDREGVARDLNVDIFQIVLPCAMHGDALEHWEGKILFYRPRQACVQFRMSAPCYHRVVEASEQPLIIIVGPTGSGKSDLALRVAETFRSEIVGCDSLQIFRHFDIGTAKLTPFERAGIAHHLIDMLEPVTVFTAGDYAVLARTALEDIARRGRIPVVVGGTGFYLTALLHGLFPGPQRNQPLRELLAARESKRPGALHRILCRLDPVSASRIHANDVNKITRALEVRLLERRPISALFAQGRDPLVGFQARKIGLNPSRAQLYARINARAASMFANGLIEEVCGILDRGVPVNAKPFESLGYRQALDVVQGRLALEDAIASTQLETRHYSKRQMTWFRRDPDVQWFAGFGQDSAVQNAVLESLQASLVC